MIKYSTYLRHSEKKQEKLINSYILLTFKMKMVTMKRSIYNMYSGRGKFMPLPLKSKILETPGSLATDDTKMFPI
jgi:hypothetical protein